MFFLKVKTNKEDNVMMHRTPHEIDKEGNISIDWIEENIIKRNGKEVIPLFYFILLYAHFSRMKKILINLLLK